MPTSEAPFDHAVVTSIERQLVSGLTALAAFWRPKNRDFWRDTVEMRAAHANRYYPTATFMAVACLEEGAVDGTGVKPTPGGFDAFPWLEKLRALGAAEALASSEISTTGGHHGNLYTASQLVRALALTRNSLSRRHTHGRFSASKK